MTELKRKRTEAVSMDTIKKELVNDESCDKCQAPKENSIKIEGLLEIQRIKPFYELPECKCEDLLIYTQEEPELKRKCTQGYKDHEEFEMVDNYNRGMIQCPECDVWMSSTSQLCGKFCCLNPKPKDSIENHEEEEDEEKEDPHKYEIKCPDCGDWMPMTRQVCGKFYCLTLKEKEHLKRAEEEEEDKKIVEVFRFEW